MVTPAADELIELDRQWGKYIEEGTALVLPAKRALAIPVAIAAEAVRWKGLDGRDQMIADFFSIAWINTPAADRPTDSKGVDFIPCQFHRYVNNLAAKSKQVRTYPQYKLLLTGLHAYITGQVLTRAKQFDVAEIGIASSNPFRG
jgi:hypothetical protein